MSRGNPTGLPRKGFTLVEALTALMVLSALVRLSIPGVQEVVARAEAARALADIRAVKGALEAYRTDHGRIPSEIGSAATSSELEPYLPNGFSFNRGRYRMDLHVWSLPSGLPHQPHARTVVGLALSTPDPVFAAALYGLAAESLPRLVLGNAQVFILDVE